MCTKRNHRFEPLLRRSTEQVDRVTVAENRCHRMRGVAETPTDNTRGNSKMKVSVVIPVFNDHGSLERCLRGLEQQSLPLDEFEVIIVDNGSSEPVHVAYAGHHRIEVETRPGSYAARNKGITVAGAPIIAFTDADCIPSPGWLEAALTFFAEHPEIASIGGSVQVFPEDPLHRTPIEVYEAEHGFPQEVYVGKRRFAATANLFVRRTVFDGVGTFSSDLRSGGDVEFGNRSIDAGYPMRYVEAAMVRHPARRSFQSYTKKQRRTMAGTRDLASLRGNPYPYPIPGAMRNLLPPFRSILRALGDSSIGPVRDRVKYSMAIVVTHYARAFYRFFLRYDRSSPR